MRLVLAVPSGWRVLARGSTRVVVPANEPQPPAIQLEIDPLYGRGRAPSPLVRMTPSSSSAELRWVALEERRTLTGFPLRLLQALVLHDGFVIEGRLGAWYQLGEHDGIVVARAQLRAVGRWEALRREVLTLLMSARLQATEPGA
jgi:hypothetical protein